MSLEQKEEIGQKHIGKLKYSDEIIDKNIKSITLLPPKTAFEYYYEETKSFSSTSIDSQSSYKSKYLHLPIEKRNLYSTMEKSDKERFSLELEIVKKYLVPVYYKEGKSAQEIFIEDYFNNMLNDTKPKNKETIENEANQKWNEMDENEKAKWIELQKENDQWWIEAKSCSGYNTLSVYEYFTMIKKQQAEEKGIQITSNDIESLWNRISENKLKEYIEKAKKENEKRKEYREIIDIESRAPPQQPLSAYQIFVQQKMSDYKDEQGKECKKKNNAFKYISDLWGKISDEERKKYNNLAHRQELLFRYKQILYKEAIKEKETELQKENKNKNIITGIDIFIKEHIKESVPIGKTPKDFYNELWNKLDTKQQAVFIQKAEKINSGEELSQEIMNNTNSKKNKPKIRYQIFFKERNNYVNNNKEELKKEDIKEIPKTEEKKKKSLSDNKENRRSRKFKVIDLSKNKKNSPTFISLNN